MRLADGEVLRRARHQLVHEGPVPVDVCVDVVRDGGADAGDGVAVDGRPAVAFRERGDGRHRDGVVGQLGREGRVAGFVAEAAQVGDDVVQGFGPAEDGERPVWVVGGGDEPRELLEQGDVVAFVLERPLVLGEAVAVGPGAGFRASGPPELGVVSVGVLWVGESEACDFEGYRVTAADGDFEDEP